MHDRMHYFVSSLSFGRPIESRLIKELDSYPFFINTFNEYGTRINEHDNFLYFFKHFFSYYYLPKKHGQIAQSDMPVSFALLDYALDSLLYDFKEKYDIDILPFDLNALDHPFFPDMQEKMSGVLSYKSCFSDRFSEDINFDDFRVECGRYTYSFSSNGSRVLSLFFHTVHVPKDTVGINQDFQNISKEIKELKVPSFKEFDYSPPLIASSYNETPYYEYTLPSDFFDTFFNAHEKPLITLFSSYFDKPETRGVISSYLFGHSLHFAERIKCEVPYDSFVHLFLSKIQEESFFGAIIYYFDIDDVDFIIYQKDESMLSDHLYDYRENDLFLVAMDLYRILFTYFHDYFKHLCPTIDIEQRFNDFIEGDFIFYEEFSEQDPFFLDDRFIFDEEVTDIQLRDVHDLFNTQVYSSYSYFFNLSLKSVLDRNIKEIDGIYEGYFFFPMFQKRKAKDVVG